MSITTHKIVSVVRVANDCFVVMVLSLNEQDDPVSWELLTPTGALLSLDQARDIARVEAASRGLLLNDPW